MSALTDPIGGVLDQLVEAARGMTDAEVARFLTTGELPDLSRPPAEDSPEETSELGSEQVMSPTDATLLLAGITPLTAATSSSQLSRHGELLNDDEILVAAGWRAEAHPRDRHGKFIEKGAVVDLLSAKKPTVQHLLGAVDELDRKKWDDLTDTQRKQIADQVTKLPAGSKLTDAAKAKVTKLNEAEVNKAPNPSKSTSKSGEAALGAVPRHYLWDPKTDDWETNGDDSPDIIEALDDYAGPGYKQLNADLRRFDGDESKLTKARQSTVAGVEKALAGSELAEPISVIRGVKDGHTVFGDAWNGDMTGASWIEHGFASTSANPSVASGFSGGATSGVNGAVMHITVAPGVRGVVLSDMSDEAEVLLERGLTFRVAHDRGVVDGKRQLDVEVTKSGGRANVGEPTGDTAPAVPGGEKKAGPGAPAGGPAGEGGAAEPTGQVAAPTGKKGSPGSPVVTTSVYKKNPDGHVVAESPDGTRRLRWDAGSKKWVVEERADGEWKNAGSLSKKDAYDQVHDVTRWVTPGGQTGNSGNTGIKNEPSSPPQTPEKPPAVVEPAPKSAPKSTAELAEKSPTEPAVVAPTTATPQPAGLTPVETQRLRDVDDEIAKILSDNEYVLSQYQTIHDKLAAHKSVNKTDSDWYHTTLITKNKQVGEKIHDLTLERLDLLLKRDGEPWGEEPSPNAERWKTALAPKTTPGVVIDPGKLQKTRDQYVGNDTLTVKSNASLRSGAPSSAAKSWRKRMNDWIGSSRLLDDATVYRGAAFTPEQITQLKIGSTVRDLGIMSTANTANNATFYAGERVRSRHGTLPVVFTIRAPKGRAAVDAGYGEYVFGSDTDMRITSIQRDGDRVNVVAEMLPRSDDK